MVRSAYSPLPVSRLEQGVGYHRPRQLLPERVSLESPAVDVMTDLRQVQAITIDADSSADDANARMIKSKVRLLLVVDEQERVLGLITATDILGEKPMQVIRERGCTRSDVRVRDLMTPQERLEVLNMDDVLSAKVGHIVSTLQHAGRQHAMVVDIRQPAFEDWYADPTDVRAVQTIRGIFSTTQIARQLGMPVQTTEVARTFAEIEAQFAH